MILGLTTVSHNTPYQVLVVAVMVVAVASALVLRSGSRRRNFSGTTAECSGTVPSLHCAEAHTGRVRSLALTGDFWLLLRTCGGRHEKKPKGTAARKYIKTVHPKAQSIFQPLPLPSSEAGLPTRLTIKPIPKRP